MKKFTVTIARQFGSLGRPIAKKISQDLGIEFYDRDIVEQVSKNLNLPVSIISDEEEKVNKFSRMKYPLGTGTTTMQDTIFYEQRKIIMNLADKENCIIVGRCADYILQDKKNILRVYICASFKDRLKNCVETLGMSPAVAKKMIKDVDRARSQYHRHYAGYLPGDLTHTDLVINSGTLGIDKSASIIENLIKSEL